MSEKIRWGILSTGNIAHTFAKGLAALRDAELVAVGSRSKESADAFGEEFDVPHRHATYEELAADPDVDAIYVATPHPFHCENTLLCLNHGKAVLCEKPFAMNAKEARKMISKAKSKGLFLMEAMWTRFLPVHGRLREIISEGTLGDPRLVRANFCFRADFNPESRLFAPELGGGGLLDIGVYTIAFASMIFRQKPSRIASMADLGRTGVDEQASMILGYGPDQMASLTCATRTSTPHDAWVFGTKGYARVHHPFWHATELTLHIDGKAESQVSCPYNGNGYNCEAAEVNRCLRAGKLESSTMPLDETVQIMETMDEIRSQWGLTYPGE